MLAISSEALPVDLSRYSGGVDMVDVVLSVDQNGVTEQLLSARLLRQSSTNCAGSSARGFGTSRNIEAPFLQFHCQVEHHGSSIYSGKRDRYYCRPGIVIRWVGAKSVRCIPWN